MTRVLMVRHRHRPNAVTGAVSFAEALKERGINIVDDASGGDIDMVLSIGGDGAFLVVVSSARALDAPLLGINAGHMGFLTELGDKGAGDLTRKIADGDFSVERRMTLDVTMEHPDRSKADDWVLNEAVVMHTDVAHPVHFTLAIDDQEVSTYGTDGMILSTPTGSTAYSFSAGGPIVWPDTEAIVVVPLAAHGLFTCPLVVGSSACMEIVILDDIWTPLEVWYDGLRRMTVPAGVVVRACVGSSPIQLVRMDDTPFSACLIRKFNLLVRGWGDDPR